MSTSPQPSSSPLTFVHGTSVVRANMSSETRLNQLVKGAPTTSINPPAPAPLPHLGPSSTTEKYTPPDLSALPSSPPAIYLNLLILESSLRSQYLHLLSRRRLNTFFVLILFIWNLTFTYALFLRPREDGHGHGGSVYWMVEALQKVALMGGVATALLIWATGQWERGVRWPRKWLGTTNRGLRGFNLRVVVVKRRWYREMLGHLAFLAPLPLLWSDETGGFTDWHMVENETTGHVVEEDLAKGGDHIMLLLLPKSFSPEFRENWEEYRSEYWEKENERRASLRRQLKGLYRKKASELGGWKWYTGLWRIMPHRHHRRNHDLEKHPAGHHHTQSQSHTKDLSKSNRRRSLMRSDSAHSGQSSRSSTPVAAHFDLDGISEKPLSERVRRGSSVSSTASMRKKKRESTLGLSMTSGDGLDKPKRKHTRPKTPDGSVKIKKEEEDSKTGIA